jgi:hypothetical protein
MATVVFVLVVELVVPVLGVLQCWSWSCNVQRHDECRVVVMIHWLDSGRCIASVVPELTFLTYMPQE